MNVSMPALVTANSGRLQSLRNTTVFGHVLNRFAAHRALAVAVGVIGVVAIIVYFMFEGVVGAVAYLIPSVLALIGLVAGPLILKPRSARPWLFLALGQAAFVIGDVIWFSDDLAGTTTFPSFADLFYLCGYPFFAIGLVLFIRIRRPRYRLARAVDAAAIGVAAAMIITVQYLQQTGPDSVLDLAGTMTLLAYPLTDAALLSAATYLFLAGGNLAGRSQQLLFAGLALLLTADLAYLLFLSDTEFARSPLDGLWMLSYVAVGLSALTPSMRELTKPQPGSMERGASRSMAALLAAIVVLTVLDIGSKLAESGGTAWLEIAEVALVVLLLVRVREAARLEASHERHIAGLLANASDALALVSPDGFVQLTNPAVERMFGIEKSAALGQPVLDFLGHVHPADREIVHQGITRLFATPGSYGTQQVRMSTPTGEPWFCLVTGANRVDDPAVGAVVLNFRDVTDHVRAGSQLSRLGTAIEQASDAVLITDPEGKIEYVNPAFERLTGYGRDEVIGQNPRFLKSGEQKPAFYDAMWKTLTAGRPWSADFVNRRKDGSLYRMAGVITPLRDRTGSTSGYVGVSRDLTRQRALEDDARRMARERSLIADTIRGIDPRQAPEKIAHAVCGQLASLIEVAMAGLFIFDADGRAAPYGFVVASGEQAPQRRVPRARSTYLRERTEAGPWIEAWTERPAHPYNELIMSNHVKALAYAPVRDNEHVIGFVFVGSAAANAEEQLARMLSVVVECGEIVGTLIGIRVAERSQQRTERQRISRIIDNRTFSPVYQPLRDAVTERIVGYEALTRFDDGVAPDLRFAEAHEAGLGERLELAAVQAAIEGAASLPAELWLNINASPMVVLNGGELARLLNESGHDIVLEVTEHTEIADYQAFRRAVQELGPKVRLAIDDAGSGFASLRHILELRPAFVKLDRQVIAGIDGDEARQAMVAGLRHFAQNTGCWLIAEGVETPGELRTLRDLDVRYVQGYLMGRPLPAHELGRSVAAVAKSGGAAPTQLAAPRSRRR